MAERDGGPQGEAELRSELARLRAALEAAEERAEQAERFATLGRLLAGVVHELNNPLTAVTMYADSLASRAGDPGEQEKAAAILEAAGRIQRMSRELIGFVRPSGKPSPVDLGEIVDEALRLARPELKACGANVERTPGSAVVQGSRQSLTQVVLALVSNAAHATGSGRRIRVAVASAPGEARITVADEGEGMAGDVLARAFEPFFTTSTSGALGLGLSTCKAIVERHGGRVALESAPGRGTTAVVALPAAK